MASSRTLRWFQFGILDLLISITAFAVVLSLCRPAPAKVHCAPPWIFGIWAGDGARLWLEPDGFYDMLFGKPGKEYFGGVRGVGWTLRSIAETEDVFLLESELPRLRVRSEWGSGTIEILNEDGSVNSTLQQIVSIEGPMREGKAHGTWVTSVKKDGEAQQIAHSAEYRNGELKDLHYPDGSRSLSDLNSLRKMRRLPPLSERDFPRDEESGNR